MSTQVSESFIKQFEADVHLCYQQNGSKLRNTVLNASCRITTQAIG